MNLLERLYRSARTPGSPERQDPVLGKHDPDRGELTQALSFGDQPGALSQRELSEDLAEVGGSVHMDISHPEALSAGEAREEDEDDQAVPDVHEVSIPVVLQAVGSTVVELECAAVTSTGSSLTADTAGLSEVSTPARMSEEGSRAPVSRRYKLPKAQAVLIQEKALSAIEELLCALQIMKGDVEPEEYAEVERGVRLSIEAIGMYVYVPMFHRYPNTVG